MIDKHPKCERAGRCLEAIECPEGRCAMRLAAFAQAERPRDRDPSEKETLEAAHEALYATERFCGHADYPARKVAYALEAISQRLRPRPAAVYAPADPPRPMELEDFSDEAIDRIADLTVKAMPEGISGFCKYWGWRQFARTLLSHYGPTVNRHALNAAQEKARADALLEGLRQARDAFVSANDQARGPIVDTVWMPGQPQTLLDHLERLIDEGAPT